MKYYLIAGEASGDLHASHLMRALKAQDPEANFRFFGGDLMQAEGGTLVRHYRELAYMGFIPVLLHLRTILGGMKQCRQDIMQWKPDVLILVDYPGFNLKIAKQIKKQLGTQLPIYYYISPKIWAWKEHRIKAIRRDIDRIYSILPFEVDFFEGKHHYPIDYVGNPTVDEVTAYLQSHPADPETFRRQNQLDRRPIIALLAGSRKQEIKDNLTRMTKAAESLTNDYQLVLAGAPGIDPDFYQQWTQGTSLHVVYNQTYPLLQHSIAALVTSGTATLETALFRTPQVVCYYMKFGKVVSWARRHFLKVPYISLVNLVADQEVVPELVADQMNADNCRRHLLAILPGGTARQVQLEGYELMADRLGAAGAPEHAARLMVERLRPQFHSPRRASEK